VADSRSGRLVAIDGAVGRDVAEAATALYDNLTERHVAAGVSRWDASGLFTDVLSAPAAQRDLSPRNVLLLYAADLAFRIRWEIAPALEQGLVVVAAPYVTTAISFGLATGLSHDWLRTLFRFAPHVSRGVVLRDRKPNQPWKRKPDRGFAECCTTLLQATPEGFKRRKTRAAMVDELAKAADKDGGLARMRDLRHVAAELAKKK
jgi:thymidylate kinase